MSLFGSATVIRTIANGDDLRARILRDDRNRTIWCRGERTEATWLPAEIWSVDATAAALGSAQLASVLQQSSCLLPGENFENIENS